MKVEEFDAEVPLDVQVWWDLVAKAKAWQSMTPFTLCVFSNSVNSLLIFARNTWKSPKMSKMGKKCEYEHLGFSPSGTFQSPARTLNVKMQLQIVWNILQKQVGKVMKFTLCDQCKPGGTIHNRMNRNIKDWRRRINFKTKMAKVCAHPLVYTQQCPLLFHVPPRCKRLAQHKLHSLTHRTEAHSWWAHLTQPQPHYHVYELSEIDFTKPNKTLPVVQTMFSFWVL